MNGPAQPQLDADLELLSEIGEGFDRLEADFNSARTGVRARERGYFTPDEDDRVRQMLLAYRRYRCALYEIIERYRDYESVPDRRTRLRAFMIGYAAALTLFIRSLKVIHAYEHEPLVRAKLNEADARFDLEAGFFDEILDAYTSFRNYRLLADAARFWRRQRRELRRLGLLADPSYARLARAIRRLRTSARRRFWAVFCHRARRDWRAAWRAAFRPAARARYGLHAFAGRAFADLRTTLRYRPGIDDATLDGLRPLLQPGDIVLVRTEQKITTALLPGFWSHAAIFIGDRSDVEKLACGRPRALHSLSALEGHDPRHGFVIEAVSAGVRIWPLTSCLHADHVLVLRPRISHADRLAAVETALDHVGKPYDFEFDFNVTTRLVCTEVVYRCYHRPGHIEFTLTRRIGRYTLTGDDIVDQYLASERDPDAPRCRFDLVSLVMAEGGGRSAFVPSSVATETLFRLQHGWRPAAGTIA